MPHAYAAFYCSTLDFTDSQEVCSNTNLNATQQSTTMAPLTNKNTSAGAASGTNHSSVSSALRRSRREAKRTARAEAFWQSIATGATTRRHRAKTPPQALNAASK